MHTRPEDDFRFLATKQKVSRFAGKKNAMLWWWLVNFKRTLISWWRRHDSELLSPRPVAYSRFLWLRFYPEMTAKLKCKEPPPGTWSVTIGSQLVPCFGTTLFHKSWRVPPLLVNSIKPTTQRTGIIKIIGMLWLFSSSIVHRHQSLAVLLLPLVTHWPLHQFQLNLTQRDAWIKTIEDCSN